MALKPVGRRGLPLAVGREAQHQLRGERASHLEPVAAGRPVEPEVETVPLALEVGQLDLLAQRRQQLDGERVGVAAHAPSGSAPRSRGPPAGTGRPRFRWRGGPMRGRRRCGTALTLHEVRAVVLVRHAHRCVRRRRSGGAAGHARHPDRLPRQPQLQRAHAHQRRPFVLGPVDIGTVRTGLVKVAQVAVHGRAGQRTDDHQALRERQERLAGMELRQHRGTQVLDAVRVGDRHLGADRQPARPRFLDAHLRDRPGGQRHSASKRAVQAAAAADGRPLPVPDHLDPLEQGAAAPHGHPHVTVARGYHAVLLAPGQVACAGRGRGVGTTEPDHASGRQGATRGYGIQQRPAGAAVGPSRVHAHLCLLAVRVRGARGKVHPRRRLS